MKEKELTLKWYIAVPLAVVGLVVFVWLNYQLLTKADYPNTDFTHNFYAGAKVILQGGNPYHPADMQAVYITIGHTRQDELITAFTYPLWTALVFVPLALLPLDWAVTAWGILNEVCFGLTFWLLFRTLQRGLSERQTTQSWRFLFTWGLALFLPSRHFVKTLLNGQTSIVTTFFVALFIYATTYKHYRLAGLVLLVGMFKPTPFVLFLPLALLWLWPRERRQGLYALVVGGIVVALPAFALNPGWVKDWLGVRTGEGWQITKILGTVWGTVARLGDAWGLPGLFPGMAVVLAVALLAIAWQSWRKLPVLQGPVLAWGMVVTLSIYLTLYAFSYESMILFIPLIGLLDLARRFPLRQKGLVLVGLAILYLPIPWLLLFCPSPLDEGSAALFPLSVLIFTWLVALLATSVLKEKAYLAEPG